MICVVFFQFTVWLFRCLVLYLFCFKVDLLHNINWSNLSGCNTEVSMACTKLASMFMQLFYHGVVHVCPQTLVHLQFKSSPLIWFPFSLATKHTYTLNTQLHICIPISKPFKSHCFTLTKRFCGWSGTMRYYSIVYVSKILDHFMQTRLCQCLIFIDYHAMKCTDFNGF